MLRLLLFTCGVMILQCTMCYHISNEGKSVYDLNRIGTQSAAEILAARGTLFPSLGKGVEVGLHSVNTDLDDDNNLFTAAENDKNEFIGNRRSIRQSDFLFDEDNAFNDIVVPNFPNRPNTRTPRPNVGTTPGTTTQRITTSTIAIPGMATARSPCENRCLATTQFDPVCGDNQITYTNVYWLRCAQRCGKNVQLQYPGACPRTS